MKKKLPILGFSLLAISITGIAQTSGSATLDINQVKAQVNSDGNLFWNNAGAPKFEVPSGSSKHTIFADALWIGGYDSTGQLHIAAQTYNQTGFDFFNGPVSNSSTYNAAYDAQWAKVWKINKTTIDSFAGWFASPSLYPNYQIPQSILTWPGNGNVTSGQAAQLAPFIDVNGDGTYDPTTGDYPCIKGDQFLYFIYNDDRNVHTETAGQALKVEIHATVYAYNRPGSWQDSAVYVNYRIYNRSNNTYGKTFVGKWTDFDIGYYQDDFVGCDVQHGFFYGYNGTTNDGGAATPGLGTYGANPPAQGVMFLRGPDADVNDGVDNDLDGTMDEAGEYCRMNTFIYYNNDFTVTGNPKGDSTYYRYMAATWIDGSNVTYGGTGYGGTLPCLFMYPGTSDPSGFGTNMQPQPAWDETTAGNTPEDRRGIAGSGPFSFSRGESLCLDFVYLFGRGSTGPSSSVQHLQAIADSALTQYDASMACACKSSPLSIQESNMAIQPVSLYPNPANSVIFVNQQITSSRAQFEVIDITGRTISSGFFGAGNSTAIDVSALPNGIYTLRIVDGKTLSAGRFIKQ